MKRFIIISMVLVGIFSACARQSGLDEYTKTVDGKDYLIFQLPDKYLTSEEIEKCILLDTLTVFNSTVDENGPHMTLSAADFVKAGLSEELYNYLMAEEEKERASAQSFAESTGVDLKAEYEKTLEAFKENPRTGRDKINALWK